MSDNSKRQGSILFDGPCIFLFCEELGAHQHDVCPVCRTVISSIASVQYHYGLHPICATQGERLAGLDETLIYEKRRLN